VSGIIALTDEQLDALADRIAERLRQPAASNGGALVDAAQLAAQLGVSRTFVYAHAAELGARRLGGPRGRLRFDPTDARTRLASLDDEQPAVAKAPRSRRRRPAHVGSILRVRS
jgi:hypothetical protein